MQIFIISNPLFSSNSVCRCCCSDKDGCNKEDNFCQRPPQCPPLEARFGLEMKCSDGRELDSSCSFRCPEKNHRLVGAESNNCVLRDGVAAMWTPEQPECEAMCEMPLLTNQIASCTNGNLIGSVCSYSCPAGTRRIGADSQECVKFGNAAQWTADLPRQSSKSLACIL